MSQSKKTANRCDPTPAEHPGTAPLSTEDAQALLLASARALGDTERLPTAGTLGRVLAEPLISPSDLPAWDQSAMDGYAIRAADLPHSRGELRVSQRIAAGQFGAPLAPGTAARIFTGAPTPEGADTVVVQEICEDVGGRVRIPLDIRPGENVRHRGEDIRAGDVVIPAGTRLGPQHLGLAASVGAAALNVHRRLRVALFASGDELVMPGQPLGPGQIYNSNRFMLSALLSGLGCEVLDLGIVEDDLDATVSALEQGARQADLVLASGGVSVGDEDHVRPAVARLGRLDLWRVAMRPGKPVAFGHIAETPFIGSPGNPVSAFVTFCLFARPFILAMQGVTGDPRAAGLRVPAGFELSGSGKRREYRRARLERDGAGLPSVQVFPNRSSAAIHSLTWANGLVDIPAGAAIRRGDPVTFIPFSELLG